MIEQGEFIEWAEVHGAFYGTSKKRLEALVASGKDALLDIDTQGALQIKRHHRGGVYIFVLPPSMGALKARLKRRMTDSPDQIDRRLQAACAEIRTYDQYDYVIINDEIEEALKQLASIIIAQRARAQKINPLWIQQNFFNKEHR